MTILKRRVSACGPTLIAAALLVFASGVAAEIVYPYGKLLDITPYEKHCVSTSNPGDELKRCLNSQPDTQLYALEQRKRSLARLNILNEIAYDMNVNGDDDDPWTTFCANTTPGGEANICYPYCLDGIPCPYD